LQPGFARQLEQETAAMAVDYFLKIDSIKGESTDDKHKDQIELVSWSWGETQSGGGQVSARGGLSGGRVSMQDFSFMMSTSKASPPLMLACATGEHFKDATLECCHATKDKTLFLKIKMSDCMVTSYQTGGSSGAEIPTEQVSLNFGKIEFEYTPTDTSTGKPGGAVKAGWDLKANKKV
jgi:type VI secretion system secreted protein Hcp